MITIDRSTQASIHDQIRQQIRYQIAGGRFKVDEALPSTRKLASQLDVSFHTVRRAYQELEREGILESRPGAGFIVKERVPLPKSERMERGAAYVQDTLQRLIGMGLSEVEIDYLFEEQLSLLEGSASAHKLVVAMPAQEMAELCAGQIQQHLPQPIHPAVVHDLERHQDADFVFTPFAHVQSVMTSLPRADVVGIMTYLNPEALERIARLLDSQTLGVVTKHPDAIQLLASEIRSVTSFSGQMVAMSIDAGQLAQLVGQTDLIAYTPPCRRRLLGHLRRGERHVSISPVVSDDSLKVIRQTVPS